MGFRCRFLVMSIKNDHSRKSGTNSGALFLFLLGILLLIFGLKSNPSIWSRFTTAAIEVVTSLISGAEDKTEISSSDDTDLPSEFSQDLMNFGTLEDELGKLSLADQDEAVLSPRKKKRRKKEFFKQAQNKLDNQIQDE